MMKVKNSRLLNKRFILIVSSVILVTAVLFGLQMREGTTNISTYTAQRGEFVTDIRTRGELEAPEKVMISTPNVRHEIRITRLIPDGTYVEKGDFLVQFDMSDAQERVTEREDRLENARAELASVKASIESNMKELISNLKTVEYSYEQAKIRYDMMKYEALAKKQEGELNLKQAELTLEQAKAQVEAQKIIDQADRAKAEVDVKRSELRYNQAVEQLNSLTILAPKAGVVVLHEIFNRSTRTREKIKVGDSPHRRMPILSIPSLSEMIVKTKIREVAIRKIQTGQKAIITLDALQGRRYNGTISSIAPLAHRDEGTDIKVFDIEITIDTTDELLKPGMTAQCTIITNRYSDQLYIPLDSVFEKEDTTVVYIKNRGFEQRFVKVGDKNSNFIIIEEGLNTGEKVALRDPTVTLEEYVSKEPNATPENGK